MIALFGAAQILAYALGEPVHALVGPIALALGTASALVGRARWTRSVARARAQDAAIPAADRLDGDALERVADALGGACVAAVQVSALEALREDVEASNEPTRFDHVRVERAGLTARVYRNDLGRTAARADGGPGIVEQSYWRVRVECQAIHELHVVSRHWGHSVLDGVGLASTEIGEPALDEAHVFYGDLAWLRARLTPNLRAWLTRHPGSVLRARRGRVEILWPSAETQTLSRFTEATSLVFELAHAVDRDAQPRSE